jgi:nucleoside-diphosphate-sugar epimerase
MGVLILGGTGAMGVHLVQLLADSNVETVVTSRKLRKLEKVSFIQGDAHDISFLQSVLTGRWDAIVDFMVYTTQEFKERVNLLLNATSQYIYLSSARVYAESVSPITESSPRLLDVSGDKDFLSTDEYSLTKARQEDILRLSGRNNWTVIRPYITYSERRLQLGVFEKEEWLYRALHNRTIVISIDINSRLTTMTFGLDVAKGIAELIGNPKALGEIFHITATESCSWEKILSVYLRVLEKHLGHKPRVLLIGLEDFWKIRKVRYPVLYDRLFNRKFDNSKMAQYLDVASFSKIETGLEKCLIRFLREPQFSQINWRSEALKDKLANERTPLNEIIGFKQKIVYLLYRYISQRLFLFIKKSERYGKLLYRRT